MVKTVLPVQEAWVQSLVRELRSHKPCRAPHTQKKSLKSDLWAHTPGEYINILFFINLLSVEDNYWNQLGFPGGSVSKESPCNSGDLGLIPESRGSPDEGNGYPHQTSLTLLP